MIKKWTKNSLDNTDFNFHVTHLFTLNIRPALNPLSKTFTPPEEKWLD